MDDTWTPLVRALRDLHAALLRRVRADHLREPGAPQDIGPGELLMLATRDERFAWLRELSELMTDIDYLRDDPVAGQDPGLRAAARGAIEQLLSPPDGAGAAGAFAARYREYLHDEPEVTMAHAAVRRALSGWPPAPPPPGGRGELVAHRERHLAKRERR